MLLELLGHAHLERARRARRRARGVRVLGRRAKGTQLKLSCAAAPGGVNKTVCKTVHKTIHKTLGRAGGSRGGGGRARRRAAGKGGARAPAGRRGCPLQ